MLCHFTISDFFSICNKTLKLNSENRKTKKKSFIESTLYHNEILLILVTSSQRCEGEVKPTKFGEKKGEREKSAGRKMINTSSVSWISPTGIVL